MLGKKTTDQERKRAKELYDKGWKYRKIAKDVGRNPSWVCRIIKGRDAKFIAMSKNKFKKNIVIPYLKEKGHEIINPRSISDKQIIIPHYIKEPINIWSKKESFFYITNIYPLFSLFYLHLSLGKMLTLQAINSKKEYKGQLVYQIIFSKQDIEARPYLKDLSAFFSSHHDIEILSI